MRLQISGRIVSAGELISHAADGGILPDCEIFRQTIISLAMKSMLGGNRGVEGSCIGINRLAEWIAGCFECHRSVARWGVVYVVYVEVRFQHGRR